MSSPGYLALVGTRDEGNSEIHALRADRTTGELHHLGASFAGENPSFVGLHPDGERLYAVNQVRDGTVTSFTVDGDDGSLRRLGVQSSEGERPCYCRVDAAGRYLFVANYDSGTVAALPIRGDGSLGAAVDVVAHVGASVDPVEQASPHPHSVVPGPENRFVYVADLGSDRIAVYDIDERSGGPLGATAHSVATRPGSGPRHLAFHPDGSVAYVVDELDSTLTAYGRDERTGALEEIATADTLPPEYDGENTAADVHVHPSGRWVYASNRGHDSVAVFEADARRGRLRLFDTVSTGGRTPRNFAIGPWGTTLLVANKSTNEVVSFQVDTETGDVVPTGHAVGVPRPTCVISVP